MCGNSNTVVTLPMFVWTGLSRMSLAWHDTHWFCKRPTCRLQIAFKTRYLGLTYKTFLTKTQPLFPFTPHSTTAPRGTSNGLRWQGGQGRRQPLGLVHRYRVMYFTEQVFDTLTRFGRRIYMVKCVFFDPRRHLRRCKWMYIGLVRHYDNNGVVQT